MPRHAQDHYHHRSLQVTVTGCQGSVDNVESFQLHTMQPDMVSGCRQLVLIVPSVIVIQIESSFDQRVEGDGYQTLI